MAPRCCALRAAYVRVLEGLCASGHESVRHLRTMPRWSWNRSQLHNSDGSSSGAERLPDQPDQPSGLEHLKAVLGDCGCPTGFPPVDSSWMTSFLSADPSAPNVRTNSAPPPSEGCTQARPPCPSATYRTMANSDLVPSTSRPAAHWKSRRRTSCPMVGSFPFSSWAFHHCARNSVKSSARSWPICSVLRTTRRKKFRPRLASSWPTPPPVPLRVVPVRCARSASSTYLRPAISLNTTPPPRCTPSSSTSELPVTSSHTLSGALAQRTSYCVASDSRAPWSVPPSDSVAVASPGLSERHRTSGATPVPRFLWTPIGGMLPLIEEGVHGGVEDRARPLFLAQAGGSHAARLPVCVCTQTGPSPHGRLTIYLFPI